MIVICETCTATISVEHPDDSSPLLSHAMKHTIDDEYFRLQFNDSPIKFPIMFSGLLEGDEYGW